MWHSSDTDTNSSDGYSNPNRDADTAENYTNSHSCTYGNGYAHSPYYADADDYTYCIPRRAYAPSVFYVIRGDTFRCTD